MYLDPRNIRAVLIETPKETLRGVLHVARQRWAPMTSLRASEQMESEEPDENARMQMHARTAAHHPMKCPQGFHTRSL